MAHLRFRALEQLNNRPKVHVEMPSANASDFFGESVFGMEQMRATLSASAFKQVSQSIKQGEKIDTNTADAVAVAVKSWALAKGATHFTHWFQPLTGGTAEKHDAFL